MTANEETSGESDASDWEPTVTEKDRELYRAVIYVEHRGCPNTDLTAEYLDVRIQSVSGAFGSASHKKQLLQLQTDSTPIPEFVRAYADHNRVTNVDVFSRGNSGSLAYFSTTIDYSGMKSVSEILNTRGIYREPTPTAVKGGERWCLYLESHAALSAVVDTLEQRGYPVVIQKKDHVDLDEARTPWSLLAKTDLTPRQREVFLTAVDEGYFAVDSETTLEDLAETLDLSTSSIWEHLSRAKEKILTNVANEAL